MSKPFQEELKELEAHVANARHHINQVREFHKDLRPVAEMGEDLARAAALMKDLAVRWGGDPLKVDVVTTKFGSSAGIEHIQRAFQAVHFDRYEAFINDVFFASKKNGANGHTADGIVTYKPTASEWRDQFQMDAYKALEYATDAFLAWEMGTSPPVPDLAALKAASGDPKALEAYRRANPSFLSWADHFSNLGITDASPELIDRVAAAFQTLHAKQKLPVPDAKDRIGCDLLHPFFMEIAGVRQAEGAILMRYQNQRVVGARGEALVQLNLEANDSLNAWLKGRVEAYQQRRLTGLPERANEYFAEVGQSVLPGDGAQPADVRTGLMPALLGLVRRLLAFYDAEDNKMMVADGRPVLQAFKELQIKADEAEANRAYDMPIRLRKEMLVATAILRHPTLWQALVARTQVRRAATYQNVFEAVKEALGWDLPDITHYQDLAYSAEILIGAGQAKIGDDAGPWARVSDEKLAAAAASTLRNETKTFSHAYRAVTGIDLGAPNVSLAVPAALVRVPTVTAGGRNVARAADPVRPQRYPAPASPDGLSRRLR